MSKQKDIRHLPAYTIAEAAHYLSVAGSTVRYWSKGQNQHKALIRVPRVPENYPVLLSFINLVELHVLAAIRKEHKVSMVKVRSAIKYLKRITTDTVDKQHPLISKQLETDGLDLFIEKYGKLINISQDGQIAMKQVIGAALHRISRDANGIPIKLYPYTRNEIDNAPAIIVIDPEISAGRPVISGTGLATELIAERYKAGESIKDLAVDYECDQIDIEEAIRCELQAAA